MEFSPNTAAFFSYGFVSTRPASAGAWRARNTAGNERAIFRDQPRAPPCVLLQHRVHVFDIGGIETILRLRLLPPGGAARRPQYPAEQRPARRLERPRREDAPLRPVPDV